MRTTDPRLHIPALALLGLSFTACDEKGGIAATWQARRVGEESYPQVQTEGTAKITDEMLLVIGEDLKGELLQRELGTAPGVELRVGYSYDVEVEGMDPEFRVLVPQYGGDDIIYTDSAGPPEEPPPFHLDCVLSGDQLRCNSNEEPPRPFEFVRGE